jgi:hypothetical protein
LQLPGGGDADAERVAEYYLPVGGAVQRAGKLLAEDLQRDAVPRRHLRVPLGLGRHVGEREAGRRGFVAARGEMLQGFCSFLSSEEIEARARGRGRLAA